jgi:hypothetical protein
LRRSGYQGVMGDEALRPTLRVARYNRLATEDQMDGEIEPIKQNSKVVPPGTSGMRGRESRAPSSSSKVASELSQADRFLVRSSHTDPREGLTPVQRRVLWRLARGQRVATVAALERVHPERVRRWLATPLFQRALLHEAAQPTHPLELLKF